MGAYTDQNTGIGMNSNPSMWSAEQVDAIEVALSTERFARYLRAASSKSDALKLYEHNTALSAAFYGPLQCLEVSLRNAVNSRLAPNYGARWFANESVLVGRDLGAAREAVEQVEKVKDEATPGRVVAELSFGFWVGLFANVYDQTLWRTDLYHLFSPRPQRRQLHEDLDKLRTLRNRIAHHEPIFQRALLDDYNRLTSILRSIDPHTCAWMEHNNRVLDVLAAEPGDYGRF